MSNYSFRGANYSVALSPSRREGIVALESHQKPHREHSRSSVRGIHPPMTNSPRSAACWASVVGKPQRIGDPSPPQRGHLDESSLSSFTGQVSEETYPDLNGPAWPVDGHMVFQVAGRPTPAPSPRPIEQVEHTMGGLRPPDRLPRRGIGAAPPVNEPST
jgi:hypothetical protein